MTLKKVLVTGANGLLGWHAAAHLHAENCAANFKGDPSPYQISAIDRQKFADDNELLRAIQSADVVLHFAGVNRAEETALETANVNIANRLLWACETVNAKPHIIYANSIHSKNDSVYGRSKRAAQVAFEQRASKFTNVILPHIFGEGARPYYNNVTATLIENLINDKSSEIDENGQVNLLHAGRAVDQMINLAKDGQEGEIELAGLKMSISELFEKLDRFHSAYMENVFPSLESDFDISLFNAYRASTYPNSWPRKLKLNKDSRGCLFEAIKSKGGGGQSFASTTLSGVTRGDHFHINKIERFLVLRGKAKVRMRRVLTKEVWEFDVSGEEPCIVDMPTLYTHSLENVGSEPLITLFWTNEIFDPKAPDTFADRVIS
ncbi:NAD-dependent epimerase/dehydratase family protein [Maritalea myrionectae]|uniref:polysaccharide biosynthesis C-terminal domain-containing protein n=1 Tax=Maritalea myrionectae TaxID=454601 RepID=UPI0004286E9E|nr:NAD-dependent epimerase/dehydratase family protein [Maritalea myrionectae]